MERGTARGIAGKRRKAGGGVGGRAGRVGKQGWMKEASESKHGGMEHGEMEHGTQGIRHTHGLYRGMGV
jgi:hypothetical protein